MGKFRPRRNIYDEELRPHDFTPKIYHLMQVLNRGEVYDAIEELRPLWWQAIRVACRINRLKTERRQATARLIWSLYCGLYDAFLDKVREMHENGTSPKLAALKAFFKRVLNIEPQWLIFHCVNDAGEILHVMV